MSINQFKLNCLMFAEYVVLLSQTASGLQNCINQMSNYCSMWQLSVNISKTKVVIFNKGGHRISRFTFSLHGETIEITKSYTYLGIVFASSGSFQQACNDLTDKAKKAFFKLRMLNPQKNAILTIKLFQMLIMPIVTYGSEVWGPFMGKKLAESSNLKSVCDSLPCEIINMKLCKYILGVNKHATNDAVRGELGRFPLLFQIMQRSFNIYSRAISLGENHLMKNACNSSGLWFSLLDKIIEKIPSLYRAPHFWFPN